jgi:hypothetical protein
MFLHMRADLDEGRLSTRPEVLQVEQGIYGCGVQSAVSVPVLFVIRDKYRMEGHSIVFGLPGRGLAARLRLLYQACDIAVDRVEQARACHQRRLGQRIIAQSPQRCQTIAAVGLLDEGKLQQLGGDCGVDDQRTVRDSA